MFTLITSQKNFKKFKKILHVGKFIFTKKIIDKKNKNNRNT